MTISFVSLVLPLNLFSSLHRSLFAIIIISPPCLRHEWSCILVSQLLCPGYVWQGKLLNFSLFPRLFTSCGCDFLAFFRPSHLSYSRHFLHMYAQFE